MATTQQSNHTQPEVPPEPPPSPAAEDTPEETQTRKRAGKGERRPQKAFVIVGLILLVILGGALGWWLTTRGKESTDDAEVQADVVALAPRVGGEVARVPVQENSHVKAGETILEIDDADYALKVRQAEADVEVAEAAIVRTRPERGFDERELVRSRSLREQRAIPEDQLERAEVTARGGRAAFEQAVANLAATRAALDVARLQLSYTRVTAPADGRVSSIMAHPGTILAADQPFAQFVPDDAYVVANFKETQIGDMHPGQRASVTLDAYGHHTFDARVVSFSAGTGAAFSLLPPNNATGNFVKVVQRVPVRIRLVNPPQDLPLRSGLSADVTVYLK